MTAAGCADQSLHRMDEWISAFFATPRGYAYDGNRIELSSETTRVVLRPLEEVEPARPLEGTRWEITHLTQGSAGGGPSSDTVAAMASPPGAFLVVRVLGTERIRAVLNGTVRWEIHRSSLNLAPPSGNGLTLRAESP